MTMTDPIADMLTRLRNANQAYHDSATMPSSKLKTHIAEILQQEGYIAGWSTEDGEKGKILVIELKYHHALHVLADMAEIFLRSEHVLALVRGGVLVPVPLHARKARERGYNQAALLAAALARAAGGETQVQSVLRRVTDTATQTACFMIKAPFD